MNTETLKWMLYYDRQEARFLKMQKRIDLREGRKISVADLVRNNVKIQEWIEKWVVSHPPEG